MRTWAEIDLDALRHNYKVIKSKTKCQKIMAIIKADAYGHGAVPIAQVLSKEGVYAFGVATADEAIELRCAGFEQPILILGVIFPEDYHKIIENNITCTIADTETALELSLEACKTGKTAHIHIKLDTGMGRIGFVCGTDDDKTSEEIKAIYNMPGIQIDGIFSHMARADEKDKSFALCQLDKFQKMCKILSTKGVDVGLKHIANSASILELPETHLDMVRTGIITYGLNPSGEVTDKELKNVMTLKTKVTHIKKIQKASPLSYGGKYVAQEGKKIATIAIGYADGFSRILSDKAHVLINGKKVPVRGNICMDQCMIDVTETENIKIGDEVIIFGSDGNNTISVDSVALLLGTINYEVVCSVTRRVPRAYIQDGKIVFTLNHLVQ